MLGDLKGFLEVLGALRRRVRTPNAQPLVQGPLQSPVTREAEHEMIVDPIPDVVPEARVGNYPHDRQTI